VKGEGIKPKNGKRKNSTIAGVRRDGDFMAKEDR
jgi:hypothetical protein